ncbi:MAG: YihY/virulence factor BrkB family protein [Anaerolineaceae bacterium]|jgi:membrane protein|nr:YihY/virulence factor BrkB family protein [Anaerolineaceae bacterium]
MYSLKEESKKIFVKLAERFSGAREFLKKAYYQGNKLTGGMLGIIRHTFTNFSLMRGAEAAASLSYYALFSISPILLASVSIASIFLEREVVQAKLLEVIREYIPVSVNLINNLITGVLEKRGAFTLVAFIGLVWSASNVFDKIIKNINRAFPKGRDPGFIQSRAMALVIILVIVVLFLGSLAIDTIQGIFPLEEVQFNGIYLVQTKLYEWLRWVLPLVIKLLLFFALYSWIPRNKSILFKARLIGSLVSASLWELATRGLTWMLSTGYTNYEPVYGSLSSIIALMTWMYLSGYILFLGAHLTHAVNYHILARKAVAEEAKNPDSAQKEIGDVA